MSRPLHVFLCHSSQDKPAVRELYNALKAEDWIDPWLDKAKILPGQDWEMIIEKAVDISDVVIICLSNQSVSKEGYVQREIRYAYDMALEKPENAIFLIPLRLDDCDVPRKLRILHWVDYFGFDKENSYSDLLEALKLRYEQKSHLEENELRLRQNKKEDRNKEEQKKIQPETDKLVRKTESEKEASRDSISLNFEEKRNKTSQKKTSYVPSSAANNKVNMTLFEISIGAFFFICLCGGFLWWLDATYRWCVFLPFIPGC